MEILKIHAAGIAKHGEIDYEVVVKLACLMYLQFLCRDLMGLIFEMSAQKLEWQQFGQSVIMWSMKIL